MPATYKVLGLGILLSFLGACAEIDSQKAKICGEVPVPRQSFSVEISTSFDRPEIDHTLSRDDLSREFPHFSGYPNQGVLVHQLIVATTSQHGIWSLGNRLCFWVESIHTKLSYSKMRFYIASDYPQASCEYQQIAQNLNKRLTIARNTTERFIPQLREALNSSLIPKPHQPIETTSLEITENELSRQLKDLVAPVLNEMREEIERLRDALDTSEAEREELLLCNNWLP